MTLALRLAGRSDVGLVRALNEDSGYAVEDLLLVADGMGGHAAGEVASRIATETVAAQFDTGGRAGWTDEAALGAAVDAADAALGEAITMDPDLEGMGTTLTLARLQDGRLLVAHVGDSRGYLFQAGTLSQITRDHTFVQQLVDEGSLAPEEVAHHPARSVLTQALDGTRRAEPDISVHPVALGDRVLLCSDGLSGVVEAHRIAELLADPDLAAAADALVAEALAAGAPDNVTVVLAEVVDTDGSAAALWLGATAPRSTVPDTPPPLPAGVSGSDAAEHDADDADDTRGDTHGPMALLGAVLMVLGGLGTLLGFAHVWASQQWYVADVEGRAAIVRGLPQPLLGLPTGGPVEISEVRVANLPQTEAQRLTDGIAADDEAEATEILQRIRQAEAVCLGTDPVPGCPR